MGQHQEYLMSKTVGFGEIMGRLSMPQHKRFIQGLPGSIEMTFAGAEANVCATVSMLGQKRLSLLLCPITKSQRRQQ